MQGCSFHVAMCKAMYCPHAGFWRWRVADLMHVKAAPWPLRADAHIFDVVLVVISGFAVQQIAGQLWRVFFTRIPEQARALLVLLPTILYHVLHVAPSASAKCSLVTVVLPQWRFHFLRDAGNTNQA